MTRFRFPCPPCEQDQTVDILDIEITPADTFSVHGVVRMTCPECGTPIMELVPHGKFWEIAFAREAEREVVAWRGELEDVKYLSDLDGAA